MENKRGECEGLTELQKEDDDERCVRKLRNALRLVCIVMGDKCFHLRLLIRKFVTRSIAQVFLKCKEWAFKI